MKDRHRFHSGLIACCIFVSSFATCAALAADNSKTVSLHQVPAAVKKTIEDYCLGGKLGQIEREDENGEVTFSVTLTKSGGEREFTVAEDGRLVDEEVTIEETPPPVRNAIKAQIGQGTLESITENLEETEITYDVDIKRKDGVERSFSVALDGKLVSVQIALDESSPAARKTIEATLGNGKLEDIYRTFEDGKTSYYVEVRRDGKLRDFSVGEDGKVENVQVFLPEMPSAVQQTIQSQIGNGKIVRIDRTFERKMGVLPFEVEGRKDGKPFNFSVGPKGRFLGMDE